MAKIHPQKQRFIDLFGHDPESLDELAIAVVAITSIEVNKPDEWRRYAGNNRTVGFAWEITHRESVSNSHHAPLDGHTNWGGSNKAAKGVTGYPGWEGRVWIRFAKEPGDSSGAFRPTLTHPGTGGAGDYDGRWKTLSSKVYDLCRNRKNGYTWLRNQQLEKKIPSTATYSWDFRFFDSDFPKIAETENYRKRLFWDLLKEAQSPQPTHSFVWEDPETVKFDKEFLAKANNATVDK